MYFGPTGYRVEVDKRNAGGAVGPLTDITKDITEVSGINKRGVVVSGTALADAIETEIATGVIQIERIVLKGFVQIAAGGGLEADGAYKVLGQVTGEKPEYSSRTVKLTHKTGITQQTSSACSATTSCLTRATSRCSRPSCSTGRRSLARAGWSRSACSEHRSQGRSQNGNASTSRKGRDIGWRSRHGEDHFRPVPGRGPRGHRAAQGIRAHRVLQGWPYRRRRPGQPAGQRTSEASAPVRIRPPGEAAVVYGGRDVPYAAAVHDGVRGTGVKGQSVPTTFKRGKSGYLRDPAMQGRQLLTAGAAAVRKALNDAARQSYKSVRAVRGSR